MNIELSKDGTISKEQVWLVAWCCVAASDTCKETHRPAVWADKCLEDFKARFDSPNKPYQPSQDFKIEKEKGTR